MEHKEYNPVGEIMAEWEEAKKATSQSDVVRGTITVGCGGVYTLICC